MKKHPNVSSLIRNKTYFRDVLTWYNDIYIQPIYEKSMIVIWIVLSSIIVLGLWYNAYMIFPLTKRVGYAVLTSSKYDTYANIYRANAYGDDINSSVAKILCEHYVKMWQEYNSENIRSRMLYIYRNSSKDVFNQYYSTIKTQNPMSKVLTYGNTVSEKITITDTVHNPTLKQFTIHFAVKKVPNGSDKAEYSRWKATLTYTIEDMMELAKTRSQNIGFVVTDYKVQQILK